MQRVYGTSEFGMNTKICIQIHDEVTKLLQKSSGKYRKEYYKGVTYAI